MSYLIEYERGGKTYVMTPQDVCNELIYRAYAESRFRSPLISPVRWAVFFPEWHAFEQRYQQELTTVNEDDKRTFCA